MRPKRTTSVFSFNVDVELKKRFRDAAFFSHTTMGPLLNLVMEEWLKEYDKKNIEQPHMSEEARLADWEWRKGQVEKGELSVNMADEYPVVDYPGMKYVYKTLDGSPRNGRTDEQIAKDANRPF